jgi:hypothetical protein
MQGFRSHDGKIGSCGIKLAVPFGRSCSITFLFARPAASDHRHLSIHQTRKKRAPDPKLCGGSVGAASHIACGVLLMRKHSSPPALVDVKGDSDFSVT